VATKKKPTKKKPAKKAAPKKKPAKKAAVVLKNRIAILLDSSGSMQVMRTEAINAFNAQIEEMRKGSATMDTKVSFYTFDTVVNPKFKNQPVDTIKTLTEADYVPNGVTALYDAIGQATTDLSALPEADDKDCSFLVVIVTDGHENNSKNFSFKNVTDAIEKLQKTGRWTFTYLGAGAGLHDVGASFGISAGNTLSGAHLQANGVYTQTAAFAASSFMRSRAGGQSATMSFYSGDQTNTQDDADGKSKTVTVTKTVKTTQ
jgi:uncharacterized protein YegL